jgi:hypothetical protein
VLGQYSIDDRMINEDGAVGEMKIGRGYRSIHRRPAPVPLCPAQILRDLRSNPSHCVGKPETNRLSNYVFITTHLWLYISVNYSTAEEYHLLVYDVVQFKLPTSC